MIIVLANQFKNEEARLQEWLLYHKTLGITNFVLVDDHSTDRSVEIINSIKGINVDIIKSEFSPIQCFSNSKDTNRYAGNGSLAMNIAQNYKIIHDFVVKKYGTECYLGYFDVDEFIFSKNNEDIIKILNDNAENYPTLMLSSLEVNSFKFNTVDGWLTLQTTNSMSEENRQKSTRSETIKSFQNLKLKDQFNFFENIQYYNIGIFIHAGAIHPSKGKYINPNNLAFLHYRHPMYSPEINANLCDVDYDVVKQTSEKAKKEIT